VFSQEFPEASIAEKLLTVPENAGRRKMAGISSVITMNMRDGSRSAHDAGRPKRSMCSLAFECPARF